jgi:1-deoxy-D-xylulose-5-phosphate reductoisomerase
MKKKIAILGSTGSIGKTLLDIINIKKFEIILLTANKNYKLLLHQAKIFNVKNIIIKDYLSFKKALIFNKDKNINIFNSYDFFNKIIRKKLDYVMSCIIGIDGLKPTFTIIKFTKKIAIANKESIICAWPIIKKELIKNKTEFVPVDSEHFSIWTEIKNINPKKIKKIYLTASGGPLLNHKIQTFRNIDISSITKHPTWKMGKKISVDSATLMNKCFEVIEAKHIFNLNYKQIDILIHPDSYVHAIVMYNNGFSKIIVHDTTMKIPIFNTIYSNNEVYTPMNLLSLKKLNKLNFQTVMINKFPLVKFLNSLSEKHSMFETILVSVNDTIVNLFLEKKIKFNKISKLISRYIYSKKFTKYKSIKPKNIDEIITLNREVRLKILSQIV